jgi:serine/threonine-protein kinase
MALPRLPMAETTWESVKQMFTGALQQPPEKRDTWLESVCSDPAIREQVRALLGSHERAPDFLEHPCTLRLAGTLWDELPDPDRYRRFESGDQLGRYVIDELLAVGGMGEVYRARDTRLDRTVVLKVLPESTAARPDWRARLEREARAVSRLNHPHVCALYDIGQQDDIDFLVMEHLTGETLAARLERGGLPIEEVLTYGVQILDALEAAHQCGIVHRDLKPANVMLTGGGAKLLDFGIAKPALGESTPAEGSDPILTPMTQHGARVGTAEYMAPEQIQGLPVDQRADIFAFGAVLYEMVTGHKAFAAGDLAGVFEAIIERDLPSMRQARRGLPRGLDTLLKKCLAKDREARFRSAAEVRRDLIDVAARRRRIRRGGWVAAAAALAGAAGVIWSLLTNTSPRPGQGPHGRIMLAVLPFDNQTGDPAQEYLSEGFADELITEIGRLGPERLGVIGRSSSVRYRQTHDDLAQIGRALGIHYFVEGSVARAGPRVRIAVRLVRASDHAQVWADRYERQLDDILVLQAEIAESVAREISVAVSPEQRAQLDARSSIDPNASEHYLKGRYFSAKRTQDGLTRAVAEFEAATRQHPGYAAAYAGIAESYLLLAYYSHLQPHVAFARARPAASKALDLDSRLAEAHVSMAGIYSNYDHRWEDAETEYLHALRLNANYATAHQWYANHLIGRGRRGEAQTRILRARELEPLSLIIQVNVANIFLLSRESDRAIEECRKALEMEPNYVTAHWVLGRAYALKGQAQQAIEEFRRGLALEPGNTLLRAALARVYAQSGAVSEARSLLGELNEARQRRYVSALNLTPVYAALGQLDDAFASLTQAVDERANLLIYLAVDPDYDSLRGDPRFQEILRRIGLGDGEANGLHQDGPPKPMSAS